MHLFYVSEDIYIGTKRCDSTCDSNSEYANEDNIEDGLGRGQETPQDGEKDLWLG